MPSKKQTAEETVKAIGNFLLEFEGMKTTPNVVYMNREAEQAVRSYFPYLFDGKYFTYREYSLTVLTVENDNIGLAYAVDTAGSPWLRVALD